MNSQSKAKDSKADSGRKPSSPDPAVQTHKRILVCYDGSDNAMRALEKSIIITKESGGELTIVVAADTRSFAARNLARYFRDMRKYINRLLQGAAIKGP